MTNKFKSPAIEMFEHFGIKVVDITPRVLNFEGHQLERIDRDGEVWLRGPQIAGALGYADQRDCMKLYARHADEFTSGMTALVKLPDLRGHIAPAGQTREVRIFSLRGAHLLGMFSKTEAAKRFRHWVLDVLEGKASPAVAQPALLTQPAPELASLKAEIAAFKVDSVKDALLIRTLSRLVEMQDAKLATPRPSKRRPPLTPREIASIRKLRASGMSVGDIAKEVGRSTATVSWLVRAQIH